LFYHAVLGHFSAFMTQIHKADPDLAGATRRWLLPGIAVGLLLASVLAALANRVAIAPSPLLLYSMLAVLFALGVAVLWPISRLWSMGRDARAQGRFPPRRARVLHDTRVFLGEAAQLRGRMLQALAATLAIFVVAMPLAVAWLILGLGPGAASIPALPPG
jgi:hypothetical protein